MLFFLDILFTILHLVIIGFNLIGWTWPAARRWHLACVTLTAASWFLLGIWFGMGYCPLTDWQWEVKERLGEKDLPNSFIKYFADKMTGRSISSALVDALTLAGFVLAAGMTVYMNFFRKR
jgi:hypothetical protein